MDSPSRVQATPRHYAVLLNGRAKGWSGSVHQAVQRYVPSRDLFLTDDFRQAERTVDRLLASDYDAIFTGGGDGTIMYLINAIEQRRRRGSFEREDLLIGILRLGTGNAIAHYLGAGDIIDDLQALRRGCDVRVREVTMVESRDELFPFAGFGWDADILNDYSTLRDTSRDTALEPVLTGLGGYVAATFLRTVPRVLRQSSTHIIATNLGEEGVELDEQGRAIRQLAAGDVIYDGPARVAGVGSIPFWGFQIRMFPHIEQHPGFVEFRAYQGRPRDVILHLPSWWEGEFRAGRVVNAAVKSMRLELIDHALPYQVNGDAAGFERVVTWDASPRPFALAVAKT